MTLNATQPGAVGRRQHGRCETHSGGLQRGMTLEELLALPVMVDLETSNRALLLGRTKGFQLARQENYPIPVLRIGSLYRVPKAGLLRALGVEPAERADAVGGNPTAPIENDSIHTQH